MADADEKLVKLQVANARPEDSGRGVAHLPRARLAIEAGAEDRRRRFLALAADAARRRPRRAVRVIIDDAAWSAAID